MALHAVYNNPNWLPYVPGTLSSKPPHNPASNPAAKSLPLPPGAPPKILKFGRNNMPDTGHRTHRNEAFAAEAGKTLFAESMQLLASNLAMGHDEETAAELADRQALENCAALFQMGAPEPVAKMARLTASSNRKPRHNVLNDIIRTESIGPSRLGQSIAADRIAQYNATRLQVNAIEYPAPINHPTSYNGPDDDTYRRHDGVQTMAEFYTEPLQLPNERHATKISRDVIEMGDAAGFMPHDIASTYRPAPPSSPAPNPYAKQRLVTFQAAIARGQTELTESAMELAIAAGMPDHRMPFSRS